MLTRRALLSTRLLCLLSIPVVLILVLILSIVLLILFLLFPLLMVMMFLSTLRHMKGPTAFFEHVLHCTLLPELPILVLPVLLVLLAWLLVVVGLVVDDLVEMRALQNRTLEPAAGLSLTSRCQPRRRRRQC